MTILVVDDEPHVVEVIDEVLRAAGYGVEVTTDPRAALALVEEHPERYSLLCTDISMPDMSGVYLAAAAQKLAPHLPVLFISGSFREVPPDGLLLSKPFRRQELEAAVASALA